MTSMALHRSSQVSIQTLSLKPSVMAKGSVVSRTFLLALVPMSVADPVSSSPCSVPSITALGVDNGPAEKI